MLAIAFILALCSFGLEMTLVHQYPLLRALCIRSVKANLIVSLGISWLLGFMFGAQGVTVLLAALMATAASVPVYKILSLPKRSNTHGQLQSRDRR